LAARILSRLGATKVNFDACIIFVIILLLRIIISSNSITIIVSDATMPPYSRKGNSITRTQSISHKNSEHKKDPLA